MLQRAEEKRRVQGRREGREGVEGTGGRYRFRIRREERGVGEILKDM